MWGVVLYVFVSISVRSSGFELTKAASQVKVVAVAATVRRR